MQKTEKGIEVLPSDQIADCFAGNIGDMLVDNFFLKNTIGEFARSKIQTLIENIDAPENDEKFVESVKELEYYVGKVEDRLLKTLLEGKVARAFSERKHHEDD